MAVTVNTREMRNDAKKWRDCSGALDGATRAVDSFTLNEDQMSWAAAETGLLSTYGELITKARTLLSEGATHTKLIASKLDEVAAAYEKSDTDAAKLYGGVWVPRKK
jgi:hypothetical protein